MELQAQHLFKMREVLVDGELFLLNLCRVGVVLFGVVASDKELTVGEGIKDGGAEVDGTVSESLHESLTSGLKSGLGIIFAVVFLFGIAYALKEDGHVRVDVLYDNFSPQWKAVVNIGGTLLFLIPLSILIIDGSIWYVKEAYEMNEISGDPGGLQHRWLIKAVIPTSFIFLVVSAGGFIVRNINIFRGVEAPPVHHIEDNVL